MPQHRPIIIYRVERKHFAIDGWAEHGFG